MTSMPSLRAYAFTRAPMAAWVMLRRPCAWLAASATLAFGLNGCAWTLISAAVALDRRGIRSDVYNPGTSPAGCEARLVYNAAIDYGRRSFSDETIQYLSIIDLTLIQHGRILVTARYQTGGLNTDRFSTASTKLNGLIDKMVVDQTDLPRQPMQTIQTSLAN